MFDESTGSDRESDRERRYRARCEQWLNFAFWMFVPVTFVVILFFTAKCGIQMAEGDLPEAARKTAGYPVGAVVIAGRDGNPVYLADTVQDLRNFYYKHSTPERRREADSETMNVRRVFGRVELATIKSDADGIRVKVNSGPLADTMYWIHVSQLPDAETL